MNLKQIIKDNRDVGLIASVIALIVYSILSSIDDNWKLVGAILSMVLAFVIYMILKVIQDGKKMSKA